MIVVSGLLVIVSIILLVIGLTQEGLGFVWASIATSVVAGIFLILGALQRRGEMAAPGPTGALPAPAEPLERVTAVTVTTPPVADAGRREAEGAQMVSVVPGRPRYHTSTCRFLAGRSDVSTLPVADAREQGYAACGVCKPDQALATAAAPAPEPMPAEEPAAASALDELATAAPARAPRATTATKAPARATKAPAKRAATAAAEAPAKAAPAKSAKKTAAAARPAAAATVVVIPDRDKFHTETCRFVRDVPGTVTLGKASARRQGYAACGVCKP